MRAPESTPADVLSTYLATLRRRWLLVLSIVAVTVLAGVVVAALAAKSYDATAKVLIGQRAQVDSLLGAADYSPDPERDVNTSLALVTLEPVAEDVSRTLGLELSPAALTSKVTSETEGNSNVVAITARDASPVLAARIANAFARAYRDFRARSARASIDDAVVSAEARAARLDPGPERDALDAELRRLQAAAAFQTGGVQIVRRATAASAVASGGVLSSAIVAGFLGVVLAAIAVVVLTRTDTRVRDEGDLEAVVRCPVLGTVPRSRRTGAAEAERDALATLALSLTLRGLRPVEAERVALLTSPGPGEGTSDVTLGLAEALGELGWRSIAIEADMREPAFASRLGLAPDGGLADVLSGRRTLDDVLVELAPSGSGASVHVLPAGPALPRPQPLLAGPGMDAVIAEARDKADVVLIAGAPAGPFGDSFALAPLADVVLLVARLDLTRRDEALRVVQTFEEHESPVFGVVANRGASGARLALKPEPPEMDPGQARANGAAGTPTTSQEVTAR